MLTCSHCHQEENSPGPVHGGGPCSQWLLKVWVCLLCEVVRTQIHLYLIQCPSCYLHIHEVLEFIAEGLVQPEKGLLEATEFIFKGREEVHILILV